MEKYNGQNLYEDIKNRICSDIYLGRYNDGDRLPAERDLQEEYGISRVTVRKSLELLERDGLVLREIGRGTKITLPNHGNNVPLDMTVLIAPARNPFFSEFISLFQSYAQEKDTLVLYVEKPRSQSLEDCIFRLYKRGLRNVVIWLEDLEVDHDRLRRLRAIGMNIVFFDTDEGLPYADCVSTDNSEAISSLCRRISCQPSEISYICWDKLDTYSARTRKDAFEAFAGTDTNILAIPWKQKPESIRILSEKLPLLDAKGIKYVLCSDRECSELILPLLSKLKLPISLVGIDDITDMTAALEYTEESVIASSDLPAQPAAIFCRQDLAKIVETIYTCLQNQCSSGKKWISDSYLIPGSMIE